MKIAESVVQTIKNITHNTYWGDKTKFAKFLQNNPYFVLSSFKIENVDETHDTLIINYDDYRVKCLITWRNSQHNNGGLIMHDIE